MIADFAISDCAITNSTFPVNVICDTSINLNGKNSTKYVFPKFESHLNHRKKSITKYFDDNEQQSSRQILFTISTFLRTFDSYLFDRAYFSESKWSMTRRIFYCSNSSKSYPFSYDERLMVHFVRQSIPKKYYT